MSSLAEALAVARVARLIGAVMPRPVSVSHPVQDVSDEQILASLVRDPELVSVTMKLFSQGHYALAVEQAYKCVDRRVSKRSRVNASGQDLMFGVFSPDKPRLRLNDLQTVSDKDEQDGFKFIFGGCMRAIRNPRAHDHLFLDERRDALLMIAWADYLLRRVGAATIVRKRKAK